MKEGTRSIEIIDIHCHLEPPESISDSMLEFYHHCKTSPEKGLEDLLARMDRAGIRKTVLLDDNPLVRELIKEQPERFLGFAPIDPREGAGKIDELVGIGFSGIKLLPAWKRFFPNELMMAKIYQKACELNIPIMLHIGDTYGAPLRYNDPLLLDEVGYNYPNLKVVIAHLGTPLAYHTILAFALKYSNFHVDISGPRDIVTTSWWKDMCLMAISMLRQHQVLFGTDYPTCDPVEYVGIVKRWRIGKDIRERIFSRNALELLE